VKTIGSTLRRFNFLIIVDLTVIAYLMVAGTSAHATFPGQNGLIAFTAQTESGSQIFIVRRNGQDLHQVTHLSGDAIAPDWSPDGRRIALEIDPPGGGCNVALMNPDGRALVVLPHGPHICEGDPSFTPDGSRIVFDRFNAEINDEAFWSMDVNGNDRQRIGPCCADPNVSPDGERLSFVAFGPTVGQALLTSDIDGSNVLQLTPFTFDVGVKQDWAPDGRHLVFIINANFLNPADSANIATIRRNGTQLRFLTHYHGGAVNAFSGTYSPDGKWIVFRLEDHGSFALYKMRADGSHFVRILGFSNLKPRAIDWGPQSMDTETKENKE
jgi:Tol biopolymer transport system component